VTQPIQEPLTTRSIGSLQWGQNQLFRRPDPNAGAGNRPWVALVNEGQTIPNNTDKFSLFTDLYYDPALVPGGSMGDVFIFDVETEDGNDYWELQTLAEGWYTLEYVSFWGTFTSPPATAGYALQYISFNTTGIPFTLDENLRESAEWSTLATGSWFEAKTRLNLYRTIWLPAGKVWPVSLKQTSGASRDVVAHLKVWYEEGNFGGGSNDADWVVEVV
jgi:hypothetical protein